MKTAPQPRLTRAGTLERETRWRRESGPDPPVGTDTAARKHPSFGPPEPSTPWTQLDPKGSKKCSSPEETSKLHFKPLQSKSATLQRSPVFKRRRFVTFNFESHIATILIVRNLENVGYNSYKFQACKNQGFQQIQSLNKNAQYTTASNPQKPETYSSLNTDSCEALKS